MSDYLDVNKAYWDQAIYDPLNPESFVFRVYGRIFSYEFGIDGSKGEKLLDFGCSSGGNLRFYQKKGFDIYGVDMSPVDIERCKERMPDAADHFKVVNPSPSKDDVFFDDTTYDVVVAIQSLYYYNNTDLQIRLQSLYDQMNDGAIIYATMMGTKCYYYEGSHEAEDGMRRVDVVKPRLSIQDNYVNFTDSAEELEQKFSMFKRKHIGFYDYQYREDEGSEFHWTFVGQK